MATGQMSEVIRHLRRTVFLRDATEVTDGQLLEDYLVRRDEAALAALVRRHGPMVWGVCRRVLRNYHDAEDAFQATFLVLVRKAASIVSRELVANWLYGVAHQTALKARATTAGRRERERQVTEMPEPAVAEQDLWRDLRPLLDQELSCLPEKYRVVIVLSDLQGKTRKEAARQLGVPEGTVAGRLARARAMLAKRLARHGVVLSGGVLAAVLSQNVASAGVPTSVLSSTIQAANRFAAGGVIPVKVAALTQGVLKTMFNSKGKLALCAALALGLIAAGLGVYGTQAADPSKTDNIKAAPVPAAPAKEDKINLPTGPSPTQVLASIDKDGKLVIKTASPVFRAVPPIGLPGGGAAPGVPGPNGVAPPGGGGGRAVLPIGRGKMEWELRPETYDLDDVEIFDTKGKKLDKRDVLKLLKEDTVALASMWGQPVDPLHLRVLKEGTLVFVLPAPKNFPGGGGFGFPQVVPLPGPAPGGAPGNIPGVPGAVPPANVVPLPAAPAFPAPGGNGR